MTFPSVVSRTGYQGASSDATTASVLSGADLSGGSSSRRMAVCIFASDDAPSLSVNASSSSGWQLYGTPQASGSLCTTAIFYKLNPTNNETLIVDSDTAQQFAALTYLIDGADNISGTSAFGSSGACDPPSHDAGASRDHLWLATRGPNTPTNNSASGPSGFGNLTIQASAGTTNSGACIQVADAQITTQVEDPGTFTNTNPWTSWTLAIWDSGGGTGVSGTASGSVGLTGSSAGAVLVQGAASGTLGLTDSATGTTGSTGVTGSASGTFGITGSATGAIKVQGSASGSFGLSGSAQGKIALHGASVGSLGLSGGASGAILLSGAMTGTFALSGSAGGRAYSNSVTGTATSFFKLAGSGTALGRLLDRSPGWAVRPIAGYQKRPRRR